MAYIETDLFCVFVDLVKNTKSHIERLLSRLSLWPCVVAIQYVSNIDYVLIKNII